MCRACIQVYALAEIAGGAPAPIDTSKPAPAGCWVIDRGTEVELVVRCRSWAVLGLVAIAAFWNGIVSVFLLQVIAGWIQVAFGSVPSWFPIMPAGKPGSGSAPMSLGMTIGLTVFLIPFVVIGSLMICAMLYGLFGKVRAVIQREHLLIIRGVGLLKWTRRLDRPGITGISLGSGANWYPRGENAPPPPAINILGQEKLSFGSSLPERRLRWLCAMLQELVEPRSKGG